MPRFDFFPKFIDSAMTHRTNFGAILSILMIVIASSLCISEVKNFIKPPIKEQLVSVSDLHGALNELVISLNFTVSVPCVLLHVDVFDMIGAANDASTKSIEKVRVDMNGNPIQLTSISDECGDCYGAATEEQKCCQTCEDIIRAYQNQQWSISNLSTWAQCREEGIKLDGTEHCQAYGSLKVNAIEGGFHIAPGINTKNRFSHVHDYSPIENNLNLSHQIDHLTFGAPLGKSPLDGTRVIQTSSQTTQYKYHLKAVPTVVTDRSGKSTRGFQYTANFAEIPVTQRGRFGAGIFFVYNFAPVAVVSAPDRCGFPVLVARLISIFGGAFMLARLIDSFMYRLNTIEGKMRIGKAE